MWNQNNVSRILGTHYPIIQAGMAGGITTTNLVSSVSNSGGLGNLGAGYMSADDMKLAIKEIKGQTNQPFGVNLFIPETPIVNDEQITHAKRLLEPFKKELHLTDNGSFSELQNNFENQLEVIFNEKIPVCSFTFGAPSKELVKELKKEGTIVIGTATTVEEAVFNEECGVDIVVAQGSEAGGHRGTFLGSFKHSIIGTFSLVPQVVDAVCIPVIAAGGIMDGRGVIAALALGAKGVQMGTAFLTCKESGAGAFHKRAVLESSETHTVITAAFSGKPARGIENRFTREMQEFESLLPPYPIQNALTKKLRKEAGIQGVPEFMSMWSGQSPRLSRDIYTKELLVSIVTEVDETLGRLNE
ncbi:nitronate monooxygenase [Bacillus sp. CH30_1T]|uniref:NAD(P)H-dependent flavin oxidoreductase n=1 Tax=Bacillus sp. CH30_1T TaxID=2604836 RepID=UPI0011EC7D6C|nr:nitronate monooxygenase [Bacillus sp. CH30_1T]KAA0564470.1 nitronate monooxygenase [Bacillus sp. CH30_1T]